MPSVSLLVALCTFQSIKNIHPTPFVIFNYFSFLFPFFFSVRFRSQHCLKLLIMFSYGRSKILQLCRPCTHATFPAPILTSRHQTPKTADGGYVWARYLSWYTGANVYNYAVSGAKCSSAVTPRRSRAVNQPFFLVLEYEVPAFIADKEYKDPTTNQAFLDIPSDQTAYALWIGTNDLGNNGFLMDKQANGMTLADYVGCAFDVLDKMYASGGRYFVLMNNVPLNLSPQYATPENGGVKASKFWQDKPSNLTAISEKMAGLVKTANDDMRSRIISMAGMGNKYPGANFALFDTHSLVGCQYFKRPHYAH
jgi:hypothetical protein